MFKKLAIKWVSGQIRLWPDTRVGIYFVNFHQSAVLGTGLNCIYCDKSSGSFTGYFYIFIGSHRDEMDTFSTIISPGI